MRFFVTATALAGVVLAAPPAPAQAQAPGAPPAVGAMAPDFALPGATRAGPLSDPVRLSEFRGKTVVLAFFYRARTPG